VEPTEPGPIILQSPSKMSPTWGRGHPFRPTEARLRGHPGNHSIALRRTAVPPPPFHMPGFLDDDEEMPQEESDDSSEERDDDPTSDYDPTKNGLVAVARVDGDNDKRMEFLPEAPQYDGVLRPLLLLKPKRALVDEALYEAVISARDYDSGVEDFLLKGPQYDGVLRPLLLLRPKRPLVDEVLYEAVISARGSGKIGHWRAI
jgi:hypothetical protein